MFGHYGTLVHGRKSARAIAVFYLAGALVFTGNVLPNGKRVRMFQERPSAAASTIRARTTAQRSAVRERTIRSNSRRSSTPIPIRFAAAAIPIAFHRRPQGRRPLRSNTAGPCYRNRTNRSDH